MRKAKYAYLYCDMKHVGSNKKWNRIVIRFSKDQLKILIEKLLNAYTY